jgi:hypothetical protein
VRAIFRPARSPRRVASTTPVAAFLGVTPASVSSTYKNQSPSGTALPAPTSSGKGLLEGTARMSALVHGQDEPTRHRIRTAFNAHQLPALLLRRPRAARADRRTAQPGSTDCTAGRHESGRGSVRDGGEARDCGVDQSGRVLRRFGGTVWSCVRAAPSRRLGGGACVSSSGIREPSVLERRPELAFDGRADGTGSATRSRRHRASLRRGGRRAAGAASDRRSTALGCEGEQ